MPHWNTVEVNKWLLEAGLDRREISIDEMLSIEPTLNLRNFIGGFYTKSDMSGDIHKFTKLQQMLVKEEV